METLIKETEPGSAPEAATPKAAATEVPLSVLCVDDEPNILSAMRRLLRPHGYQVYTAGSGVEGLAVMERTPADLVISDMRMPEMDGARFLEEVRSRWPDSTRMLLTGYADIASTVAAINRGEIYRYIAKPWDDQDVVRAVRHALERRVLEREKARLELLTRQQNEQLAALNAGLERTVAERTQELRQAMDEVGAAHERLKTNFFTSVRVFSNLIGLRETALANHCRRVADLARKLAQEMKVGEADLRDLTLAGLLHDIGKFGLPDHLLHKASSELRGEDRLEVMKHPLKGEAALMAIEPLVGTAAIIRSHHEHFDGSGYPDGLRRTAIPIGARILMLADEYDGLRQGSLVGRPLSPQHAAEFIAKHRGTRYDPEVVDAFKVVVGTAAIASEAEGGAIVHASNLQSGMVLAADLLSPDRILLLAKDHVLDEQKILQIQKYEQSDGRTLVIRVRVQLKGPSCTESC